MHDECRMSVIRPYDLETLLNFLMQNKNILIPVQSFLTHLYLILVNALRKLFSVRRKDPYF